MRQFLALLPKQWVCLVRKLQHCDVCWLGEFGEANEQLDRRLAGEFIEAHPDELAEFRRGSLVLALTHPALS
jgi:hypothetical protein